ncbi:MAG: type II toxin-antitoxin system HicB family antitoxin [Elusimicrobiota bacterium]
MKTIDCTVLFEPAGDGGYNVRIPAIPEICTFGETLDEAKQNAQEAMSACFTGPIRTGK